MRAALCVLTILGCSHPAPRAQPNGARQLAFQPEPMSLPADGPVTTCAPPACVVIRDAAAAPAPLQHLAATVDFSRFVLVAYHGEARYGERVLAYDGTLADGVVDLPAPECPYCGGATPPPAGPIQIVVRVPRIEGDIRMRERRPACARCPSMLP